MYALNTKQRHQNVNYKNIGMKPYFDLTRKKNSKKMGGNGGQPQNKIKMEDDLNFGFLNENEDQKKMEDDLTK